MKPIHFKQIIFIALGILTLKRFIHFGDYCTGMTQALLHFLLLLIFIFVGVIYIVSNCIKYYKKKESFNWFNLLFLITILSFNGYQFFLKEKDKKNIILKVESICYYNRTRITFYKDSIFEKRVNSIENSCFTFGNYTLNKNKITLLSNKIGTKKVSSESYLIKDSLLIPLSGELKDTLKIID